MLDDLRAKIVDGPAHCPTGGCEGPDRPAEIWYFELISLANKNILGFNIAMEHIALVDVVESLSHLENVLGNSVLLELLFLLE